MSTSPLPPLPSYTPAQYLAEGSFLTASQLIYYFKDFYASLEYVGTPQYVFERLVGNLDHAFTAILEQERERYGWDSSALGKMKMLRLPNSQLEPDQATSCISTSNNPVIGSFHTTEVRSSDEPCKETPKVVSFTKSYSAPPSIPLGLTSLHLSKDRSVRSKSFTKDIRTDGFHISIDSWDGAEVYSASYSWLEIESNNPDFQCGSFDTLDDHPIARPQHKTTSQVTFSRPYSEPPQIVVWINKISVGEKDSRLRTYATDVTATGFKIHIETWGDTSVYHASASWVACTANKKDVFIGSFDISDLRSGEFSQQKNCGYVGFGSQFTTPPRVVMAVNKFDISSKYDMRLLVKALEIKASGMTWSLGGWLDTIVYSAGASFIALG